jgi:acetylornithine deacetylase/succinyl-diaminopimelate desuccinylase-like protein
MRRVFPLVAMLIATSAGSAQDLPQRLRDWVARNEAAVVRQAVELYSIPNVASDSVNIRRNAARLLELLRARGADARLLESPAGGPPAVFGELRTEGATRTIVLYAHYDGQPVATGPWLGDPWQPVLRTFANGVAGDVVPLPATGERVDPELRIYARSASDDKGPIVAMLAALDALRASGIRPRVNVKFFFEGEEEAGSPHLGPLLEAHRDLLAADVWIFADGPVHVSGAPQLVLGVRGVAGVTLTTFGPSRALHSGHYGNWAPNPAVTLAHLLTSLRDINGRILMDGFYDDVTPPTDAEREAAARLATTDDSVRRSLRLGRTEADNAASAVRIMQPALNVRGLRAGGVGTSATNAIPVSASASIDFRLVPRQTPERIRANLERHIAGLGFDVVQTLDAVSAHLSRERVVLVEWDGGYRATRTSLEHPVTRTLAALTERAFGRAPFIAPTLGGSLPMYLFEETLRAPLVVLPMVNADNTQHAPDENLRLRNLFDGIVLYGTIIAEYDQR